MKLPRVPAPREWPRLTKAYLRRRWFNYVVAYPAVLLLAHFDSPRHFRNAVDMCIFFELIDYFGMMIFRESFDRYERDLAETKAKRAAQRAAKAQAKAQSASSTDQ